MYAGDHPPPHFQAMYAEYEALIDVRDMRAMRGSLPRRAMALVLEWAAEHRDELGVAWGVATSSALIRSQTLNVAFPTQARTLRIPL